jgi:hypothetical protein
MTAVRHTRLAVRTCPECTLDTLVSNGAFWRCEGCRYAVTSTALAMDLTPMAVSLKVRAKSTQGIRTTHRTENNGTWSREYIAQ